VFFRLWIVFGRILMGSGVYLPTFESVVEGNSDFGLTGLGRGGQQVQRAIEVYSKAVETLVELASLQVPPYLPRTFPF
jgi:vacuolar-type H+-ATPase subunit D/Vma8